MKKLIAAVAALTASAAVAAQQQPAQESEAQQAQQQAEQPRARQSQDKSERLICRRITDTGSTIPQRVCLTARQWRSYGDR